MPRKQEPNWEAIAEYFNDRDNRRDQQSRYRENIRPENTAEALICGQEN